MAERTNKLILETEYKTTGVEQSVTKLDALEKARQDVNTQGLQAIAIDKKIEQESNVLGKSVETLTRKQTALSQSLKQTGEAMSKVAKTGALKEAFKNTGVDQFSANLDKFVKSAREAKTIDELTAKVNEFVDSLPQDIRADVIRELDSEFKRLEKTLTNPVTRLRELKRLINTETDPVLLRKYLQEAGKLQDKLGDTNELVRALASDTFFSDTLVEGAQQAVGAFTAFQGIVALSTDNQEEFARAAAKAQGALALLQGTQSIITNLKKEDNIVTRVQIAGQLIYSKVIGQSTGAMKLFRIALAATGIGLAVVAIAALVENWDKLSEAIGLTNKQAELNQQLRKKAIESSAEEIAQIETLKVKIQDQNTTQEERVQIIKDLQEKYPAYLGSLDAEKVGYAQLELNLNRVTNALLKKAKADAAQELLTEKFKERIELQNSALENNLTLLDKAAVVAIRFTTAQSASIAKANLSATRTTTALKENQKDIDLILGAVRESFTELAEAGGDPTFNENIEKEADKTRKILAGSIEAFEAEVSRLTELRDKLTVVGTEANTRANEDLQKAVERLEEARKAFDQPEEIELFAPDSFKALEQQVKEANFEFLTEEERHQLALQQIEGASDEQRLNTQIAFEKERLEILQASNTATEEEVQASLNKIEELEAERDKETKEKEQAAKVQRRREAEQAISEAVNLANVLLGIEINRLSELSRLQEQRVNEARDIADKGNASLLEQEEKRLDDINKQREKFVKRQQQLAQLQLVASAIVAVAKAAETGPLSPIFIASTLIALAAGLAQARALAQSQSFYKGGLYDGGGYTGHGSPTSASSKLGAKPYEYHNREYIMPDKVVSMGQNLGWLKKIHMERLDIGKLVGKGGSTVVLGQDNKEVVNAIKEIPGVTFNLNSEGIVSIVKDNNRRRKRLNSRR